MLHEIILCELSLSTYNRAKNSLGLRSRHLVIWWGKILNNVS